ncbi:MAG: SprT family zinc-dependent metalloprotease [Ignavibacteria bacterium]|nr:SprT family zinc-dependent metalloprotease [Ignavibacteria bacterium]
MHELRLDQRLLLIPDYLNNSEGCNFITAFFIKRKKLIEIPDNYSIERKFTRRVRIKICSDLTVKITVPFTCRKEYIREIISKKKNWIDKQLEIFSRRKKTFVLEPNEFLLFGEVFRFSMNPALKKKLVINREERTIESGIFHDLNRETKLGLYRYIAKTHITGKVISTAKEKGFTINRIFIRSQRTKWGTCSSKKNLSFNMRLIMCPEFVIDYLIIHELVHTVEMNHSKRYWETVAKHYPEYKAAKKWLDENTFAIHSI